MNSLVIEKHSLLEIAKKALVNIPLWSGIACYGASMVFWLYVLSKMELSKAYPLVSLGYVLTLFIGYFFLHENISLWKLLGIALIVTGVVCLSKG